MSEGQDALVLISPDAAVPAWADAATIGSKAYGLLRLVRLGLSIPPAFVLGTGLCREYFARGGRLPEQMPRLLADGLAQLEHTTGRRFGAARRPLLVSVRSGAPVSMPGMLESILNVGLCETTLNGLLRATGNPRQTRDCYRRLIRDFTVLVHAAPSAPFDALAERHCAEQELQSPHELDGAALASIGQESLELALSLTGTPFTQNPQEQLTQAVEAVFRSWQSDKARHYRRLRQIDDAIGMAVTVQAMVFGNAGSSSGAGVCFTRDPASGEDHAYIDFLFNAQGDDVVSGRQDGEDSARLERALPLVAAELQRTCSALEAEFRDMQDFEFTIENGHLYLLQTRTGQRTPWAAVHIAVDMVREGRITPQQALRQIEGLELEHIERTRLAAQTTVQPLASAISASIGVASGEIAFQSRRAVELAAQGRSVILLLPELHTSDIEGVAAASGVLTSAGCRTAHAAVIARQLGKVCLVGCSALQVQPDSTGCILGDQALSAGETLTLDAETGRVYPGRLAVVRERPEKELAEIARWRACDV
jgi:pyruvate, orthophosphate dikinase